MVADKDYDFSQLLEVDLEVVHVVINLVNSDTEANMMSWNIIYKARQEDGTMLKLMDHIQRGMPDSGLELDKTLREYHRFCHDLHMVNGVLCYRDCIMLPAALRGKVLEGIHASHQGVSGMAGRIDETVFWPEINPDIIDTRGNCMTCVREAPSQPAGFPVSPPSPDYPFKILVADYFSLHGHNFLVIADSFTGWNEILSTPPGKFDGQHLVAIMRDFCITWNIPEHITTDGGPQMMSGVFQR